MPHPGELGRHRPGVIIILRVKPDSSWSDPQTQIPEYRPTPGVLIVAVARRSHLELHTFRCCCPSELLIEGRQWIPQTDRKRQVSCIVRTEPMQSNQKLHVSPLVRDRTLIHCNVVYQEEVHEAGHGIVIHPSAPRSPGNAVHHLEGPMARHENLLKLLCSLQKVFARGSRLISKAPRQSR